MKITQRDDWKWRKKRMEKTKNIVFGVSLITHFVSSQLLDTKIV